MSIFVTINEAVVIFVAVAANRVMLVLPAALYPLNLLFKLLILHHGLLEAGLRVFDLV